MISRGNQCRAFVSLFFRVTLIAVLGLAVLSQPAEAKKKKNNNAGMQGSRK